MAGSDPPATTASAHEPTAAEYRSSWAVRVYELDSNGHVNNAVYLNYAEQAATEHAEALGFGGDWTARHGGTWVVRRHGITYHRSAGWGDVLEIFTRLVEVRGARGIRRTRVVRQADNTLLADIETEWVWVRLADFRPTRLPPEIALAFGAQQRSSEAP